MRVIGGSAKGRRLKAPSGARPTSDIVREAVFDTLEAHGIDATQVLDLYAGSGALGIEALSRGSEWCDFVESRAAAATVVRENLAATGFEERGHVYRMKVERAPERLDRQYTLVLADPPYDDGRALEAVDRIASSELLADGGTVVLEHAARQPAPEALGPCHVTWTRRYGDTQVTIYRTEEGRSA